MKSSRWNRLQAHLEEQLDREELDTWFGPLRVQSDEEHRLVLEAPNEHFVHTLEQSYRPAIDRAQELLDEEGLEILFVATEEGDEHGETKAELPPINVAYIDLPEPPAMTTTPEQVAAGEKLYHRYCSVCHSPGATAANGNVPDLRYSTAAVHASWDAIVRGGAYTGKGMASFAHVLEAPDAEAIRAYIVEQTRGTIAFCQSEYRKQYPELLDTACTRPLVTGAEE